MALGWVGVVAAALGWAGVVVASPYWPFWCVTTLAVTNALSCRRTVSGLTDRPRCWRRSRICLGVRRWEGAAVNTSCMRARVVGC